MSVQRISAECVATYSQTLLKMVQLFPSFGLSQSMQIFVNSSVARFSSGPQASGEKRPCLFPRSCRRAADDDDHVGDTNESVQQHAVTRLASLPDNLLGIILAFGGPQSMANLAATSRALHERCSQDCHWRSLCIAYGKLPEVDNVEKYSAYTFKKSWKERYYSYLIVPVDAPTLGHAVARCRQRRHSPSKGHRIVLRQGHYQEPETVEIPCHLKLTIECLHSTKAELTLESGHQNTNQPLLHVHPGASLVLRNVAIHHSASGHDYWHGNCAIHCGKMHSPSTITLKQGLGSELCPIFRNNRSPSNKNDFDSNSLGDHKTNLLLCTSTVASKSGRGIVAVGENVTVALQQQSKVEQCAATGIFVERAALSISHGSFVGTNGRGSPHIAAGQSNIFIDQGILHVGTDDCSIQPGSVKVLDAQLLGQHAEQIAKTIFPVA